MEDTMLYLHNPTELSLPPRKRRRRDSSEVRKCDKLDQSTEKSESHLKWENAIVGETEFDVQEQGEGWETTTSRAKRTRCTYSVEHVKPAHPQSLELPPVDDASLKPISAAGRASSISTECDSSASNSENPDCDQASKPSRTSKKSKLIGELKEDHKRDAVDTKTGELFHQSSFASKCVEATSRFLDNQDVMDILLVDVQLTVHASPRSRNVPFVSLRSEAHGLAILGYPLDVGEIGGGSEAVLLSEEIGDRGSRFDRLVWRTSKRTPVCYVSNSLSASISKNVHAAQGSKNVEDLRLPAGGKGLLRKGKPSMKLQKNRKQFNQGKPALKKTCVPVELIFNKILAAVDEVQS